ncbi:hypothetical protein CENSYa_1405 [Cenarchaeum symbiosum A]|uniref:Uncharacterized protein n=1 Tax=Cenarchaeum symbiosum (strain A) TaxID=414004 RepID=A0RXG0_CENSY|nr:hypothetical protein CENSYa_1405 [Cenarchaeum symbiosum A]
MGIPSLCGVCEHVLCTAAVVPGYPEKTMSTQDSVYHALQFSAEPCLWNPPYRLQVSRMCEPDPCRDENHSETYQSNHKTWYK